MRVVLTADGSRTLYSATAGECLHSASGAWSEARCVYLENSGSLARLQSGQSTRILEIGLGSGLNFLATADVALHYQTALHYIGIDTQKMPPSLFHELGAAALIQSQQLITSWLTHLHAPAADPVGQPPLDWVCLVPIYEAAEQVLTDPRIIPNGSCHVIYHDAFSPESSPELWTESFLRDLHRVLIPCGSLTTYCVKSRIQKRLQAVGFRVQCLPGPPGGKRQVSR